MSDEISAVAENSSHDLVRTSSVSPKILTNGTNEHQQPQYRASTKSPTSPASPNSVDSDPDVTAAALSRPDSTGSYDKISTGGSDGENRNSPSSSDHQLSDDQQQQQSISENQLSEPVKKNRMQRPALEIYRPPGLRGHSSAREQGIRAPPPDPTIAPFQNPQQQQQQQYQYPQPQHHQRQMQQHNAHKKKPQTYTVKNSHRGTSGGSGSNQFLSGDSIYGQAGAYTSTAGGGFMTRSITGPKVAGSKQPAMPHRRAHTSPLVAHEASGDRSPDLPMDSKTGFPSLLQQQAAQKSKSTRLFYPSSGVHHGGPDGWPVSTGTTNGGGSYSFGHSGSATGSFGSGGHSQNRYHQYHPGSDPMFTPATMAPKVASKAMPSHKRSNRSKSPGTIGSPGSGMRPKSPGSGATRPKSPGHHGSRPRSPGHQHQSSHPVKFTVKQIADVSALFQMLQLSGHTVVQQYLESDFDSEDGAIQLSQLLVCQCIEQGKPSKTVARLCSLLLQGPNGNSFHAGLLTALQQYYDCRAGLRNEHFRFWLSFICFLPDLFAAIGFTYGDLVQVMLQCYDYLLKKPILETLKIQELESLISCLLNVGYELEREVPSELAMLRTALRDAFIHAAEPWARKMLLLLVELSASGWKLPAEASEYYFQTTTHGSAG